MTARAIDSYGVSGIDQDRAAVNGTRGSSAESSIVQSVLEDYKKRCHKGVNDEDKIHVFDSLLILQDGVANGG